MHLNVPATRDAFVTGVLKYETSAGDFRPFPDRYDSVAGGVGPFYSSAKDVKGLIIT